MPGGTLEAEFTGDSNPFTNVSPAQNYSRGYEQDHRYDYDSGVVVMPVAQRTAKHRRIRLHGGLGMRVVEWKATSEGKPPVIPTPQNTSNDVILSSTIHAELPIPKPTAGVYQFTARGTYTYVQVEPRIAGTNALPTGIFPFPVDPMDTIAFGYVGETLDSQSITNMATMDAAVAAIENAVLGDGSTPFSWPFTVFPTSNVIPIIAG